MSYDDSIWATIATSLGGTQPEVPREWKYGYYQDIQNRLNRRASTLEKKVELITAAKVVPDAEQVTIGSAKTIHAAVMFLDICGFSNWASSDHTEQANVLKVLNIFMAEMLNMIRDLGGVFEKNTGDGLMAYFGALETERPQSAKTAVEVAAMMCYVNDYLLTPWFTNNSLWPVKFRVGIDLGPLTLGRVGIPNLADQLVAIGSPANIACKIMRKVPQGGIVVGNNVYLALTPAWKQKTKDLGETGFVYVASQAPYHAWEITHRLGHPPLIS
jgi:class 3 adenylate cyclase